MSRRTDLALSLIGLAVLALLGVIYNDGCESEADAQQVSSVPVGGTVTTGFAEAARDAFGRLRVSQPNLLLSGVQSRSAMPLLFDRAASGAGASAVWTQSEAATVLTVGTVIGEYAILQSKHPLLYRAGQSQQVVMTAVAGTPQANTVQRIGLFDDTDGLFYEWRETGLAACVRKTAIDTCTALNIAVTPEVGNIYGIVFQWLGVGSVRFDFTFDGTVLHAHTRAHAGEVTSVYMQNPHLPVRWEVRNTGTAAAPTSMTAICADVAREGGDEEPGFGGTIDNDIAGVIVDTSLETVLCLRIKSAYIPSVVRPLRVEVFNTGTAKARWALLLNPTLGSALSWTDVLPTAMHSTEYSISNVEVTAEGYRVDSGYIAAGGTGGGSAQGAAGGAPLSLGIPLGADISDVADVLCVAAESFATTTTIYSVLRFQEAF